MLFLLIACETGKLQVDDSGSVSTDDTASTDDTGQIDDTGHTVIDDTGSTTGPQATFVLDQDGTGLVLTLTQVDFGSDNTMNIGDLLRSKQVNGDSVTVTLPTPDSSTLLTTPDVPGMLYGIYVAALHEESDSNLMHDTGEEYHAVGPEMLVYIEGNPPDGTGLVLGWNVMELGTNAIGSLSAIQLPVNLLPIESITFGGSYTTEPPFEEMNVLAYPMSADQAGQSVAFLLYDAPLTSENWEITLSGEPPADHLVDSNGLSLDLEVPFFYQDVDSSGNFTPESDIPYYAACDSNGWTAIMAYVAPPTDLMGAFFLVNNTFKPGWNALAATDSQEPVLISDTSDLSVCALQ